MRDLHKFGQYEYQVNEIYDGEVFFDDDRFIFARQFRSLVCWGKEYTHLAPRGSGQKDQFHGGEVGSTKAFDAIEISTATERLQS